MLLWAAFAVMTAIATLAVVVPLARRRASDDTDAAHDAAVYRDQLAELERDRERGLIGAAEAEAARAEIGRRLLRAAEGGGERPATRSLARATAMIAILAVPLVAVGVYLKLGSPELPDQPLTARMSAPVDPADVAGMIARVEAHLVNNPGDAEGWQLIAPIYMRQGRFGQAAEAYRRVIALTGPTPDRSEAFAEALVASNQGLVTAEAQAALDGVVTAEPDRIKARFYRAEGLKQAGKPEGALADYDEILRRSPADAPWLADVREARKAVLASLGRPAETPEPETLPASEPAPQASGPAAPSADDMAAAAEMSAEDRAAMVSGMVERLAERLAKEPRDAAGWQQLIRAYGVLGRAEDAKAAYGKAKETFAGDAAALEAIERVAREAGVGS